MARNYLKYHRFSEDLDFVYEDSSYLRDLTRANRERKIKIFIDHFTPKLKEVADALGLEFNTDRSNIKFCKILPGRAVYTFKIYYSKDKFVKIEINFVEKMNSLPEKISVGAITDLFDSKELLFLLGLDIKNFQVQSYSLKEITLEKYRAVLTRHKLQERDLFDLFLIKDSLKADINEIVEKIKSSYFIKRELTKLINEKLALILNEEFFESEEKIEQLAIVKYNEPEFEEFKDKIKPILIEICQRFLKNFL